MAAIPDPTAQLLGLIDLVVNPHQTPEQVASGEYTFTQLRDFIHRQANEPQHMREGPGSVSYDTVKDFVAHCGLNRQLVKRVIRLALCRKSQNLP